MKFLGSYPRAEVSRVAVDEAYSDATYEAADAWFEALER